MSDQEMKDLFASVRFDDEPSSSTVVGEYVTSGRRRLRRRHWMRTTGAFGGAAVIAVGAFAVVSGGEQSSPEQRIDPAGPTEQTSSDRPPLPEDMNSGSDASRQQLIDLAREHLDPNREHVPRKPVMGSLSGPDDMGVNLAWTNPGEAGKGEVYVAFTAAEFTDRPDGDGGISPVDVFFELDGGWSNSEREKIGRDQFRERDLPGTSEASWVYEGEHGDDLRLAVVVERADGSMAGIGVYGRTTTGEPAVEDISVDLESAAALVADPRLTIHPDDILAETQWWDFIEWMNAQDRDKQEQVIEELRRNAGFMTQLRDRWQARYDPPSGLLTD